MSRQRLRRQLRWKGSFNFRHFNREKSLDGGVAFAVCVQNFSRYFGRLAWPANRQFHRIDIQMQCLFHAPSILLAGERFYSLRLWRVSIKNNFNWRSMQMFLQIHLIAAAHPPLSSKHTLLAAHSHQHIHWHRSHATRSFDQKRCSTPRQTNGKHQNVLRFTFVQFPADFFIRHESAFHSTERKSWLGRHFFAFFAFIPSIRFCPIPEFFFSFVSK